MPPDAVHQAGYHDGTALFGVDYGNETAERACFDGAQSRLEALERCRPQGPGSLLDVGAGYGHLVSAARQAGWKADGLEVVPAAAQEAHRLYGVELVVGDVLTYEPRTLFDVVTFGQTFEHMTQPVEVLHRVRDHLLKPGGLLLLEVPNVNSLARFLAGPRWMHWQPGDHALYPDSGALRDLLDRCGYDIIESRSDSEVRAWMPPIMVVFSLGLGSRRVTGFAAKAFAAKFPVDGLLGKGLRAFAQGVDRCGIGQDLRVVARRR